MRTKSCKLCGGLNGVHGDTCQRFSPFTEDPDETTYAFETEYAVEEIEIKKGEALTFTNGFFIKEVLESRKGSMGDGTWYFTVLVERELEVTDDE
jgi:hypothetical protein